MSLNIQMQRAMLMVLSSTNAYGLRRNTNQVIQNVAAQRNIMMDITSGCLVQQSLLNKSCRNIGRSISLIEKASNSFHQMKIMLYWKKW